ncbi:MAG: preprotein translocase subunit YajC [Bacteroidales bacterium]|nr:preprotein translocase subunit YajC [Bacteroidales bacterium]
MNLIPLQAAGAQGGGLQMIIMMVVLFAIMYFFMIRPQQKKQKELQKMCDALKVGDRVVTSGGLHGTVSSINEEQRLVVINADKGVNLTFSKDAVTPIIEK